jgi:metacaspase-1
MPKGISLHIGLNVVDPAHYGGWSGPLNACEYDVDTMATICGRQGFQTRTMRTAAATRAAVLGELDQLAEELAGGDTLVITYSGHGGQSPDRNKEESDGLDETWCLYDGQLLDDELYRAWAKFDPRVRVAVFSDSCHSGTVIKNMLLSRNRSQFLDDQPVPSPVYRAMPPEIAARTYYGNRPFYDDLLARPAPAEPACSVILISGCQDNQLSMDGPFNGAFTGALFQVWADGRFDGTYNALATAVRAQLPPTQSPNYATAGARDDTFEGGRAFTF